MSAPSGASRPLRDWAVAGIAFLAGTLLFTWPQVLHLQTCITDLWDAKLVAWILHWDFAQTFRDPLNLFQASFFHPARYVLAFSENFYGVALFGFPLFALGASPVLVYNVLLLLGMFLSALGAWALARYVTADPVASTVAGLVYAFVPWRLSQLPHLQFHWGAFLPLLLLFLLRYLDRGWRSDAALFGFSFAWNGLANVHYGLFGGVLVAMVLLYELVVSESDVRRRIGRSLLPLAAASLVLMPFYLPYRRVSEIYGVRRGDSEILFYSARPIDFLTAGVRNKLYAPLTQKWGKAEGDLFPGLAPVALAILAIFLRRRKGEPPPAPSAGPDIPPWRRRLARALDILMLIGAALALLALARPDLESLPRNLSDPGRLLVLLTILGVLRLVVAFPCWARSRNLAEFLRRLPSGSRTGLFAVVALIGALVALGFQTPYYRFVVRNFASLFRSIRAPSRAIVLFHLGLAVLAALGLALLRQRQRTGLGKGLVTAGFLLAIGFEYRAFPLDPIYPIDAEPSPVYRWLRRTAIGGAVVEWPLGNIQNDSDYLLRAAFHEKPLVNGQSGFFPPHFVELQAMLLENPVQDEIWSRLEAADVSVLVWHPHGSDPMERLRYFRAIRSVVEDHLLEPVAVFPHEKDRDFVFRLRSSPSFDPGLPRGSAEAVSAALHQSESEIAPPFAGIHTPQEADTVLPDTWCFGWALDDSGIAEIRYGTELGEVGLAQLGGKWPGLADAFPRYRDSERGGFGFPFPRVPPGRHTLSVTVVAHDGGRTVFTRSIVVR